MHNLFIDKASEDVVNHETKVLHISNLLVIGLFTLSVTIAILPLLSDRHSVNADAVVDTIHVGRNPWSLAFNPSNNRIYVANHGVDDCGGFIAHGRSSSVSVIDSDNSVRLVSVSQDCLSGIDYNPENNRMYVTTGGDDRVIMIDGLSQLDNEIGVDDTPIGIAFNPADNRIYTANMQDDDVSVIRDMTVENEIEFDDTLPRDLAFNPTNNRMYVTNVATNSISAIDTSGNSFTVPGIGEAPHGIAFNDANGRMYVTASGDNEVTVVEGANVIGDPISVGYFPTAMAYNPSNQKMYVVNTADNTVSVIDRNNRVIETVHVGLTPRDIAYNPINNRMYVANSNDDTVSVIDVNLPSSAQLALKSNSTICPQYFVQHWDKITFKINDPKLAESLNLDADTELDIRVQDEPSAVTDIKSKVLDFLGVPNATRNSTTIVDVDYAIICALSAREPTGPPIVQIITPVNLSVFSPNQTITFRGQAQDAQDGELTGDSLVWSSDKDGELGTGNILTKILSGPAPTSEFRDHTITLTAKDSDGNSASSKISVSVGTVG